MLHNLKKLENYKISATDGEIGKVQDFYFDDDKWAVRYLVVEAGTWLESRKVLISPISLLKPDFLEHTLAVSLNKEQVKNSPNIDTDKPVSRQNEEQYTNYYGYPTYWGGGGMWGEGLYPFGLVPGYAGYGVDRVARERELEAYLRVEHARHRNDDPHLRSCNEVTGYHIHATDGDIGHVAGFVVDDQTWAIRYLIVDTSNWWLGNKVLIAPHWITGVQWADRTVSVDVSREFIKNAPVYDADAELTREREVSLYRHYGRPGYWHGSDAADSKK
jgi:sporulation protein YlmC with PRC-barrel domain